MATTTNYGWTTPDDTDLVRNGADAIRDLGTAIDTSMNTALGTKKAGLVLINTTSFTAVSSFSFPNDVFTSTYENYKMLIYFSASVNTALSWRGRIAGVDTSAANYNEQRILASGTTLTGTRATSQTSSRFAIGDSNAGQCHVAVEIFTPQAAFPTRISSHAGDNSNTIELELTNSFYTLTTSFDSLSVIASAGNITGKAALYGYNV
jgi:hypothetical protein